METSPSRTVDVLVVGAGPTGLVLALWLTRMGVWVRVVDKAAEAGTTSRALAVQARTLEWRAPIGRWCVYARTRDLSRTMAFRWNYRTIEGRAKAILVLGWSRTWKSKVQPFCIHWLA